MDGDLLTHCTRCGASVKPYPPSTVYVQDAADYGQVPEGLDEAPHYWCGPCGEHFFATNPDDDSSPCADCGRRVATSARFCPHCGSATA